MGTTSTKVTTDEETSKKAKSNLAKKPICPRCGSDDINLNSKYEYEYPKDIRGQMNTNADKIRVLRTDGSYAACANCYYFTSTHSFFSTTATSNRAAESDFGCC
ncbi:unnamed protein product [Rotaria magnacalcarata]|uniref:Uncharacterized protein n=1 Tax=Rotaria magnacalcarata TaxID=392030 RepID=A0A815Y5H1_9BILA|nr:unnamed protein product [Rotaria magnacalcarata]CAF3969094.1 unnamed protein product [Rotaria magnacalcarata]CAF4896633.1 unnamed protein product [Rotaria magnacalcarata]